MNKFTTYKLKSTDIIISIILFALVSYLTKENYGDTASLIAKVLLGLSVLLIAYDVWLYKNEEKNDTISNVVRDWVNDKLWLIIFGWGVLAGHFFLGNGKNNIELEYTLGTLGILLLIQYLIGKKLKVLPIWGKFVVLMLGIVFGHFMWSQ